MKRFGLIGYPLSHSFSKKYFTEKFEKEGLKGHVYDLFPIPSIDDLPKVLAENEDLIGLNVTIPYKQQVITTGGRSVAKHNSKNGERGYYQSLHLYPPPIISSIFLS